MDAELWQRIAALEKRWFIVEGRLKQIEFLGNRVSIPAINQLRYAGRELATILTHAMADAQGNGDERSLFASIQEAISRLNTAEADILDAALAIIEPEVAKVRRDYGDELISQHLQRFPELVHSIQEGVAAVVRSRSEIKGRADHYQIYYKNHFNDLVEIYEELIKVEDRRIIPEHIRRAKRESFDRGFQRWVGWLGAFAVFHGVAFSISPEWFKAEFEKTLPLWMIAFVYVTRFVFLNEAYASRMKEWHKPYLLVETILVTACIFGFLENILPGSLSSATHLISEALTGFGALVCSTICAGARGDDRV
jgi:hypothetical protein